MTWTAMFSGRRALVRRARGAVAASARRSEGGVVFVIFALAALVVLGMVAIGIDGGRLFDERRQAQNAADHAVLTAAHSMCVLGNSITQAEGDGEASAAANGYNNDGASNTVTVTHISGTKFEATILTSIPPTFARVLGWSQLDTSATATSECTSSSGSGPGAIYAGGDNCTGGKWQIDVSGSTQHVFGGIHSNRDINVGGSNNEFTDTPIDPIDFLTHVGTFNEGGSNNDYEPGYPDQVPMPVPQWPNGWAPSDANAAMLADYEALARANVPTVPGAVEGTYFTSKITSIVKDGVYYTTHADGMDIGSAAGPEFEVVLVAAQGPIKVSGVSNTILNPFEHPDLPRENVLIVSTKSYAPSGVSDQCSKFVIELAGGHNTWNGIIWAPFGLIEMSASSNSAVNGTLIGWAVRMNGSELTITFDAGLFVSDPYILLVE